MKNKIILILGYTPFIGLIVFSIIYGINTPYSTKFGLYHVIISPIILILILLKAVQII